MDPRLKSAAGTLALLSVLFLLLPFAMKEQPQWMAGSSVAAPSDLYPAPPQSSKVAQTAGQQKLADSTALWSARAESAFTGLEADPAPQGAALQEFPKAQEGGGRMEHPKIGPLTRLPGVMEGPSVSGGSAASLPTEQAPKQVAQSSPRTFPDPGSGTEGAWKSLRENKKAGESSRGQPGPASAGKGGSRFLVAGKTAEAGGSGGNSRLFAAIGSEGGAEKKEEEGNVGEDIAQAVKSGKGGGRPGGEEGGGLGGAGGFLGGGGGGGEEGGNEGGGGGPSAEEIVNTAKQSAQDQAARDLTTQQNSAGDTQLASTKGGDSGDNNQNTTSNKENNTTSQASDTEVKKKPGEYTSYSECVAKLGSNDCGGNADNWDKTYGPGSKSQEKKKSACEFVDYWACAKELGAQACSGRFDMWQLNCNVSASGLLSTDGPTLAKQICGEKAKKKENCVLIWTDNPSTPVNAIASCPRDFRRVVSNQPNPGDSVCIKTHSSNGESVGFFRETKNPWIPYEAIKASDCNPYKGWTVTNKPGKGDYGCRP